MKTRHRIVRLRNGKYARQWKVSFMPWEFVYDDHIGAVIKQFSCVEEAENYDKSPTDIVEIVKEI